MVNPNHRWLKTWMCFCKLENQLLLIHCSEASHTACSIQSRALWRI